MILIHFKILNMVALRSLPVARHQGSQLYWGVHVVCFSAAGSDDDAVAAARAFVLQETNSL